MKLSEENLRKIVRQKLTETMSTDAERMEAKQTIKRLYQMVENIKREVSSDNTYITSIIEKHIEGAVKEIQRLAELK